MRTFFFFSTALVIAVFAGAVLVEQPSPVMTISRDAVLEERIVVSYEQANGVVSYSYLGEPLPKRLHEHEVEALRTEFSFTHLIVFGEDESTLETVSYSKQAFAKDDRGGWHYLEYATTTPESFSNRNAVQRITRTLANAFVSVAYAVDFFSGAGDGYVEYGSGSESQSTAWDDTHDATSGTASPTATTALVGGVTVSEEFNCENPPSVFHTATIYRGFLPFDTSSIPSSATISAASLNTYVTAKSNGDNDGTDYITVVRTDQGTHTTLANADYNNAGSTNNPTEGVDSGQRKDITSISTSAYLSYTLNATGLGWIAKSGVASACSATAGISCFGLREGHDTTDSSIQWPNSPGLCESLSVQSHITISTSEHTGTSQDPYLSVTYTVPTTAVPLHQDVIWFD